MIFRLITRGTIEERMMQMTKKKMVLEHLVVGRLKAQNINQVNNILLENNALFVWWQTGII
jgi:SNF2 family DNA or RNA helicase